MIFQGVRLPDELRIASEESRLVVFAGAGISVPPPSSLPSFNRLACQISGLPVVPEGREDRTLGKLLRNGTDVHAAAARILYHPGTQPTQLHEQILRVFSSAEHVKVVTTNFDDHFSTAARKVFRKTQVREFHAPALPLGDNFHGIVYLHGSARVDPHAMVLTDKDFGAAYLTRGWARDFLISLFSRYTVLFVGYSHNDVTTSYLARGLNQADIKPRWTLVSSDVKPEALENWAHLDISVGQYPIDPEHLTNPHQSLTDFFGLWATHAQDSILARSKKVQAIAAGLPPENDTAAEYLDYCLRHVRLAQDFCGAAAHPAWIGWMRAKGYFKAFFRGTAATSRGELEPHERVIAQWLCSYVRKTYPQLLLEIIETHHQELSMPFAELFGRVLWSDVSKLPDRRFSIWVSLLLGQGTHVLHHTMWAYLLHECRLPADVSVALRIFELLTSPQLRVQKGWGFSGRTDDAEQPVGSPPGRTLDYDIAWPHEESGHWLTEAWTKVFRPSLRFVAEPLVHIVTKQLTQAHLLLSSLKKADHNYDRMSWERSSIAAHQQNGDPAHHALGVLIDIAPDVLELWLNTDPARAQRQIESWWASRQPLLRRLAIHGVAMDPQRSADEKLQWLLASRLLFQLGMKKEVFDILTVGYPGATPRLRTRLLQRIERGITGSARRGLDAETIAYERFNVLIWLRRADPHCLRVAKAIEVITRAYPKFTEREHPEFDHWHGAVSFVDPNEGFDVDHILTEPPARFLDALRKAGEAAAHRGRWEYLTTLSVLFARTRDWTQGFVDALIREHETDEQIWNGVFSAWREVLRTREDWEWILGLIETLPAQRPIFAGVADLISHRVWRKELNLDEPAIDRAAALMDKAWSLCAESSERSDDSFRDWLTNAISHEGGWIGDFWVHYCSRLRQRSGDTWQGIPDALRGKMLDALRGTSRITVYARIAMTPWMDFIFAWDKEFAVENFLPLLDWSRDPVVAQQTWSVLLNYRRGTSVEMEQQLLPYYRQFADRVTGMLKEATERSDQFDEDALPRLGQFLAGLAMQVIPNPVQEGFFRDFLPLLPEKIRGSLAEGMGKFLEKMPVERIAETWEAWLKSYLDWRLLGVPVALCAEETRAMAQWPLYLTAVFPDVVSRIVRMPLKSVFAYSIVGGLQKSSVLDQFPRAACAYLVAILKAEDFSHLHELFPVAYERFRGTIAGTPEFREFEELLYLRGWTKSGS